MATSHCHNQRMPDDVRYSLTELADLAGVTPRTVRYYLAQRPAAGRRPVRPGRQVRRGAIWPPAAHPAAPARPPAARRDPATLDGLDDDAIRAPAPRPTTPEPPADSALDYIRSRPRVAATGRRRTGVLRPARRARRSPRSHAATDALLPASPNRLGEYPSPTTNPVERSQWERIVLAPDVELHVRRPLSRTQNKRVDRLVTIARELLEEDSS